ncbi:MAG TPA: alpha/beta hydrolase [Firmicutes bacterium]|nr:alpha/beta hydrolase [Bacillota bacterium]
MKEIYEITYGGYTAQAKAFIIAQQLDGMQMPPRPMIVICPGGGYWMVSDREADPVAERFNAAGCNCIVLRYTTLTNDPSVRYPVALMQLVKTVAFAREKAAEWNTDPNRVFVCGFSAGGHLAASLGAFWNSDLIRQEVGDPEKCRPNGQILCYPVLTSGPYAHRDSFINLLGAEAPEDLVQQMSLENQISQDTPPTFLWHTMDDSCVPVENSMMMAANLHRAGIPVEMHLYEKGWHGLSLCDASTAHCEGQIMPDCAGWFDLAVRFVKRLNA